MANENPLADGMYFDRPREGAPSFVKGKLSIKVEQALPMLEKYKNESGYVNFDLLQSKDGKKLYLVVNTYKKPSEPTPEDLNELPPF